MKKLLLLATGGTIACHETENGLSPALSGAELGNFVPKLSEFCTMDVRDLMQLDSTDMTAGDRLRIARAVRRDAERYDGFVIAHGTDTLSYTAALLYHLLADLAKPAVLTGSMLPMGVPDSDAPRNLLDACRVAATGRAGVVVGTVRQNPRGQPDGQIPFNANRCFSFSKVCRRARHGRNGWQSALGCPSCTARADRSHLARPARAACQAHARP